MFLRAFITILLLPAPSFAFEDRLQQFISLGEDASRCDITLSQSVDKWFEHMYEKIKDQETYDKASAAAKAAYEAGIASEGPVTYCWNVRDKLLAAGLLQ
jgi:predicted sugar kinase